MSRLPFDPGQMAGADDKSAKSGGRQAKRAGQPMTVSEAASLIRGALAQAAPAKIAVVGEVSNFSARSHWFFSIKDGQATLRCVCFASVAVKVAARLGREAAIADGMQVVVTGRLDFYDAQGHVQLYADKIELVGQGELELRFRALCDELRQAGYFDPASKLAVPSFCQQVAVVTSGSGAALADVINTVRQRWAGCRLMLYDVRVQGEQAAGEIADAVGAISRSGAALGIDAIVLTRGGGSIEDLWAFNERVVAEAIRACKVPIVAAIGHETDTTIAELVADLRCATPTQAAIAVAPDAQALGQQVDQYGQRLALLLRRQLEQGRQQLSAAARHPVFRRPQLLVDAAQQRVVRNGEQMAAALRQRLHAAEQTLAGLRQGLGTLEPRGRVRLARRRAQESAARLLRAMARRMEQGRQQLGAMQRQLEAIGPASVLGRGYSYTLGPDGKLVRKVRQVAAGDRLTTVLSDGRIKSTVEDNGAAKGRAQRSKGKHGGQPGLFNGD